MRIKTAIILLAPLVFSQCSFSQPAEKKHEPAEQVSATAQNSTSLRAYASTFSSGEAGVTLVNTGASDQLVEVKIKNFHAGSRYYWYSLAGGSDNGEFSRKVFVNGDGPSQDAGGPADYTSLKANSAPTATNGILVNVPARGVICMVVDKR